MSRTKQGELAMLRAEIAELRRRVELLEMQRYVPPPQFPVPYMPSYPTNPYQPFQPVICNPVSVEGACG